MVTPVVKRLDSAFKASIKSMDSAIKALLEKRPGIYNEERGHLRDHCDGYRVTMVQVKQPCPVS